MSNKVKKEFDKVVEIVEEKEEEIKPIIKSKPVEGGVLVFNVNKKTVNVNFLKAKYKATYDVELKKETDSELVFEGLNYKIIVNKI